MSKASHRQSREARKTQSGHRLNRAERKALKK